MLFVAVCYSLQAGIQESISLYMYLYTEHMINVQT